MIFELLAVKALLLALGMQILSLILYKDARWPQIFAIIFLCLGIAYGFVINGSIQRFFGRGLSAFFDIGLVYIFASVAAVLIWRKRRKGRA